LAVAARLRARITFCWLLFCCTYPPAYALLHWLLRQTRLSIVFGVKCCFSQFSMTSITIALSKGRIFDDTAPLLKAADIVALDDPETSRKLILATNRDNVRLIIVRASDVPTYVQYGAADMGVAGKDVLLEHGGAGLYQPLDLNIARCRMMVAVRDDFDYESAVRRGARLRVATKYLQTAREHFAEKGMHVDLIKLYGSMELAPLVGLADAIVDLVSSGNTLKANNLKAVEEIKPISARLVINQAALKLKRKAIQPMLDAFSAAVQNKNDIKINASA
jgi:ATP phosphoribosyltransferase